MAVSTSDAIFLGNFADADTDEGSRSAETAATYLGTFGSAGSPLSDQITEVSYDDSDDSGAIDTNNVGTETIAYDVGSGSVTSQVDSLAVVNLTVTYSDGSSQSFTNAVMYQDTTGNLFLTNSDFAGTDLNGTNNMPIESINVTTVQSTNFSGLFQNAFQDFVCFGFGTEIQTPTGLRRIEDLEVGDLVMTEDHGPQPIRWIGKRRVRLTEKLRPIKVEAGALGLGLPIRDLYVSQQHRLLVRSKIVRRMFDVDEALVPAKHLTGLPGISIVPKTGWQGYAHVLFDRHEVIQAEGAPAESLLPGPQALKTMGDDARTEILSIFPELAEIDAREQAARFIPAGQAQKMLAARHQKNAKPLLSLAC